MPKIPTNDREVLYPEVEARVFESKGDLLDSETAKTLLGWTVPDDGEKFSTYHIKDSQNRTVFCSNVELQRPFYTNLVNDLMWDILAGNWEFNLESVIIGKTGIVLDGKHRLTALVMACEEYERNPERYPFWEEPPALEILVALGAREDKRLANTIGTGKPRSLTDSFYASGIFDLHQDHKNMRRLCRMAEHSLRVLWTRTGAKAEAYNTKFSHSDALDFIERHPTLLSCIRDVFELNDGKYQKIESFSGAYASGLYYLMAVSNTNPTLYRAADPPEEQFLDFSAQELADQYWSDLAARDTKVNAVTDAIAEMADNGNIRQDERSAIIIKGWNAWIQRGKVTDKDVELEVEVNEHGHRRLIEDPTINGIDVGAFPYEDKKTPLAT